MEQKRKIETKRKPRYDLSFKIFFESHFSKASQKKNELFQNADIVFLEFAGWTEEFLRSLKAVSRGYFTEDDIQYLNARYKQQTNIDFQQYKNKELDLNDVAKLCEVFFKNLPANKFNYIFNIFRVLLKSNKVVEFADASSTSNIYQDAEKALRDLVNFQVFLLNSPEISFKSALERLEDILKKFAKILLEQRDKIIVSNIFHLIPNLVQNTPELQEKTNQGKKINVLIILGAAHTKIWHTLKEKGYEVHIQFEDKPLVYDHVHEAARRYMFGKEVSEELLARALAEIMFEQVFPNIASYLKSEGENSFATFIKKFIGLASVKDVEQLFNEMKEFFANPQKDPKKFIKAWSKFTERAEKIP